MAKSAHPHKAVLVMPDVGLSEAHLDKVKGEFQNQLVASIGRQVSDEVEVVVVIVVVYERGRAEQ